MRTRSLVVTSFTLGAVLLTLFTISTLLGNHLQKSTTALSPTSPQERSSPSGSGYAGAGSTSAISLLNWQLYEIQPYGYRLVYPPDWKIVNARSAAEIFHITAPDGASLTISQNVGDHGISPCIRIAERRRVTVGGASATEDVFRYASDSSAMPYVDCGISADQIGHVAQVSASLVHTGKNVHFDFFPSKNDVRDVDIFRTLLSTFSFY